MADNHLSIGSSLLDGKYRIEAVLGQGGFGITYKAVHTILGKRVAIKEFFPKEYCDRDGNTSHITLGTQSNREFVDRLRNKFIKEAQNISRFDHKNIISIQDVFEENNTAYYVMEYIDGNSLNFIVDRDGPLAPVRALVYMHEVAAALQHIHASHMMHLDVKPANIMVRHSDGRPILIDFGLSKVYSQSGSQTSCSPHGVSHGYSPLEQYNPDGVSKFSPQTDIYAFGATLYKLVTGVTPPEATTRLEEPLKFPASMPESMRSFIEKCMQLSKNLRPESIDRVLDLLSGVEAGSVPYTFNSDEVEEVAPDGVEEVEPAAEPCAEPASGAKAAGRTKVIKTGRSSKETAAAKREPEHGRSVPKKRSRLPMIIIAVVLVLAAISVAVYFATRQGDTRVEPVPDSETVVMGDTTSVAEVDTAEADTAVVSVTTEPSTPAELKKDDAQKMAEEKKRAEEKKKREEEKKKREEASKAGAVRSAAAAVRGGNMDAGMKVSGASVQGNTLVFSVTCSSNVYSAADFNDTDHFRGAISRYLTESPSASAAVKEAKKAGMTVRFNFTGASSRSLTY